MKNVLQYYYNLNPDSIHQVHKDYRIIINKDIYMMYNLEIINNEIYQIYALNKLLSHNNILFNKIILNVSDQIITQINDIPYMLVKIYFENRNINFEDLYFFSNLYIDVSNYRELDKSDWYYLWTNKIDYIEYQVSQFGKNYPLIRKSINYYIGMAETAINLLGNKKKETTHFVISHRRVKSKSKLWDIYNPLSLVIDTRVRDISEFYKTLFFDKGLNIELLKKQVLSYQFSSYEAFLFYVRMIFPTYYFDCYEEIVLGDLNEKELLKYIYKAEQYRVFLKEIYFFLKQYYDLIEVEWIIKA